MKLNLLPSNVSKGASGKTAVVISTLLFLGSVAFSIGMSVTSSKALAHNKAQVEEMRTRADAVVKTSEQAVDIIKQSDQIIRNTSLANAMIKHNAVYPDFYNRFLKYIPPFFRIISIQATPIDGSSCTVQMQGVLNTYEQYADLMLALMRHPKATSIARSGIQTNDLIVPALNQTDQIGTPIKSGESQVPSDPMARLDYYMARGKSSGYNGVGSFGTGDGPRTAAQGYSLISVSMVIQEGLQTPDPRQTINASGSSAAASTASSTTGPSSFPGMPPMPGGGGGKGSGGAGATD